MRTWVTLETRGPPWPPSLWSRRCSRDLSLHSSHTVGGGGRRDHPPGTTRQERPLWAPGDFQSKERGSWVPPVSGLSSHRWYVY